MGLLSYAVIGTLNGVSRSAQRNANRQEAAYRAQQRSERNYAISVFRQFCKQANIKVTRVDYNWCALEIPGQAPVTVSWEEATQRVNHALNSQVLAHFSEAGIWAHVDKDNMFRIAVPGHAPTVLDYGSAVGYLKQLGVI